MNVRDEATVDRWERRSAAWLTALAVLFLAVYATPILRPDLPAGWRQACETANIVIWAVFIADYAIRLLLHPDRPRFLRSHLFDLVVLVLPIVRPLRALRLVTAVIMVYRRTTTWARGRLAIYVGSTTVLLVFVAALAVLEAERGDPDSNITTYPEALWWSAVTITTVGYGDHYPATTGGKLAALALMIGGIGLIGFVTGSLASWIVERVAANDDEPPQPADADLATILNELRALRQEVAELRAATAAEPQTHQRACTGADAGTTASAT